MSLIEKLFFGEINISDESAPDRNQKIQKQLDEAMRNFCNQLTAGQKEELDYLVTLLLGSTVDDMTYVFKRGFEIGFLLSEELNVAKNKMKRMDQEDQTNGNSKKN